MVFYCYWMEKGFKCGNGEVEERDFEGGDMCVSE